MAIQKRDSRVLSVFSLVMINVIAVDNLRSLPISAEYGLSLIAYYLIAALFFMIPSALVAAELASGWPNTGGAYVWVREAFGKRTAFLSIWLQWIYNVVWYPVMLTFLAAIFAYLIDPALAQNKIYMFIIILGMFWFTTFLNTFNMETSSIVSTIGALAGTILPMLTISILGMIWLYAKHPSQVHFDWQNLSPNFHHIDDLAFMSAVLFGLIGMEMSAVHAENVRNPRRDYPRALLYSSIIILVSLIGASLAIAIVIPQAKLNLVSGLVDAFKIFFQNFHLEWLFPLTVLAIVVGGLGGISTWIIGPTKALLVASIDGSIPPFFHKTNKNGMPIAVLIVQAVIVSLLCSVFLFMPDVNSSYWLLTAMTSQLALIYYVVLFASVIKLRHSHPEVKRAYQIPGGKLGVWLVGCIGIFACISVIIFGFLPPPNVKLGNLYFFEGFLIVGMAIFCILPFIIFQFRKPHWVLKSD